jgi:hypothetical protein
MQTTCRLSAAAGLAWLYACAGTHVHNAPDAKHPHAAGSDAGTDAGPCANGKFDGTFAAIEQVIFEDRHCADPLCHGSARQGGLDLRRDAAYSNLVDAKSTGSSLPRVLPGDADHSYLFNKLRAATEPGSVQIAGSPMPSGRPALGKNELEAVRIWIEAGAPKDGAVADPITGRSDTVGAWLAACLPRATLAEMNPLAPPPASEGVQFEMPQYVLPAQSEQELCFAQYVDLSQIVPAQFQDAARGVFYVNGTRVQQPSEGHHLALLSSALGADVVHDASFGAWTCRGGDRDGDACDPLALGDCGAGLCASQSKPAAACVGFGPGGSGANAAGSVMAAAQTVLQNDAAVDGVYDEIPLRGVLYWSSHAFNVDTKAAAMHAYVNFYYTSDLRFLLQKPVVSGAASGVFRQAPFTLQTQCATWTAPRAAEMFSIASHTHKRGSNFTIDLNGERIYQSALYSDPAYQRFDPPMLLDAVADAERTLKYCAEFNNGVRGDGSPDVSLVTRLSQMPKGLTTCAPVACVAGQVGAPCQGAADGKSCDSKPGAGDGVCDACSITSGTTVENEMFMIFPRYVVQ